MLETNPRDSSRHTASDVRDPDIRSALAELARPWRPSDEDPGQELSSKAKLFAAFDAVRAVGGSLQLFETGGEAAALDEWSRLVGLIPRDQLIPDANKPYANRCVHFAEWSWTGISVLQYRPLESAPELTPSDLRLAGAL
jgi:hypothetical protein